MSSFHLALAALVLGSVPQDPAAVSGHAAVPELPPVLLPDLEPEIRAVDIEAHVVFLASDALGGRPTGSPEVRRAAEYVAAVLEDAGLVPAGDGESFLQEVALASWEHHGLPRLSVVDAVGVLEAARAGAQFEVSIQGEPRSTGSLGIVIAHTAEEIPATPASDRALLVEASVSEAREWLKARGMEEGRGWGLLVVPGGDEERDREAKLPRSSRLRPVSEDVDPPDWVTVHGPLKKALFAGKRAALQLEYDVEARRTSDPNVLATIRAAADSPVREQAIVLSAHIDHIGALAENKRASAVDGDFIFNGADDDASGVACLLELATALAAETPPARTLVFLFAMGEEVGLWGTDHYLRHPVVPLEHTVLNLNFEMLGRPDPLAGSAGSTWLTGFERSNLGPMFREHGLEIFPDPHPEEHFFERSDNIAFVMRGIVGQTLSSFNLHDDYHKVGDEADRLDYEHMERGTRTALQAVNLLAGAAFVPSWAAGEPDLGRR